jgi:hypothetical protein
MSFYDDASLVVIPSAQKTSKLYAVKPTDGSGDLTFTRTGDTATRVNSAGLIEPVLANVPRLDYLGSTCPRLLLEPQRTNLKTYSEDFSAGAGWSTSTAGGSTVTYTANYGISPDGYQNADRLQLALNGGPYADYLSGNTITNGTTYTYSIYVKSLSGTVSFYFLGGTPAGNILKTATTEWTRITHTFTASSTVTYPRFLIEAGASSSVDLLIWGAQLEAGAYATSYIPTLAASATRGADACSKTGISSLIGQTEGVLFYDFVWNGNPVALGDYPVMIYGASYNDFLGLSTYASSPSFYSYVGGSNVVAIAGATMVVGQRYKMAMAYKLNDYAFYVNGSLVGVDTSAGIPASMANLRTDNPFGGRVASTGINQAILFKTRLTNAELAQLTAL